MANGFMIFLFSQMWLWIYCTIKKVDLIKSILSSLYVCVLYGLCLMFYGAMTMSL